MNTNFFGIRVTFHWSTLLLIFILAIPLALFEIPFQVPGYSEEYYWALGLLTAILIVFSIIPHELGHFFAADLVGLEKYEGININALGGYIKLKEGKPSWWLIFVAIAGLATTLALVFFFYYLSIFTKTNYPILSQIFLIVTEVNSLLFVINFVPIYPLDGGIMLRTMLVKTIGEDQGEIVTSLFAILLSILGLVSSLVIDFPFYTLTMLYLLSVIAIAMNFNKLSKIFQRKKDKEKKSKHKRRFQMNRKKVFVVLIFVVLTFVLSIPIATILLFNNYQLLNFLPGMADIKIRQASVIGKDELDQPVLKIDWESRPINMLEEYFTVILQQDNKSWKLTEYWHNSPGYYSFSNSDLLKFTPGPAIIFIRRSDSRISEPLDLILPPVEELERLSPEDVGLTKYHPDVVMLDPELSPNLYTNEDGYTFIPADYHWIADPIGKNQIWWMWKKLGDGDWQYIDTWKDNAVRNYFNLDTHLESEECLKVTFKVERIEYVDGVPIKVQDTAVPAVTCLPPTSEYE